MTSDSHTVIFIPKKILKRNKCDLSTLFSTVCLSSVKAVESFENVIIHFDESSSRNLLGNKFQTIKD